MTSDAPNDELTERAVLTQAKAAVAAGDRTAALVLLRQLHMGLPIAAEVTPTLAEALVATAREVRDAEDQGAREAYTRVQAARGEVIRLLQETAFDQEDLAAIRAILDEAEAALGQKSAERLKERPASGSTEARRLGAGWLDQKMIQRRWGPYLVYRYRVGKTQKMKYLGKALAVN